MTAPDAGKLADIKWPIKETQAQQISGDLLAQGALLDGTPWQLEANAYGDYWLRHKETRAIIMLPLWIRRLIYNVRKETEQSVRNELKQVVGRLPRSKPKKKPE